MCDRTIQSSVSMVAFGIRVLEKKRRKAALMVALDVSSILNANYAPLQNGEGPDYALPVSET